MYASIQFGGEDNLFLKKNSLNYLYVCETLLREKKKYHFHMFHQLG